MTAPPALPLACIRGSGGPGAARAGSWPGDGRSSVTSIKKERSARNCARKETAGIGLRGRWHTHDRVSPEPGSGVTRGSIGRSTLRSMYPTQVGGSALGAAVVPTGAPWGCGKQSQADETHRGRGFVAVLDTIRCSSLLPSRNTAKADESAAWHGGNFGFAASPVAAGPVSPTAAVIAPNTSL